MKRSTRPKRCLVAIIEDDTEFRNMLRELLEEEQYRVVAVANGAEALKMLRARRRRVARNTRSVAAGGCSHGRALRVSRTVKRTSSTRSAALTCTDPPSRVN